MSATVGHERPNAKTDVQQSSFLALTTVGRSFGAKKMLYQQCDFYARNDRLSVDGAIKLCGIALANASAAKSNGMDSSPLNGI